MKKCQGRCDRVLEDAKFYTRTYKDGTIGLRSYCKDCSKQERDKWRLNNKIHDDARNTAYNKKNAERIRGMKLVTNYWPTLTWQEAISQWNKILVSQNGHCAVCNIYKRLHVDHDHTTGKVRGLLCYNHNNGLGRFQDNVDTLQKAILYLSKHKGG